MQGSERDFLRLIRDAIFLNPFGRKRADIDRLALGSCGDIPETEIVTRLNYKVGTILHKIAERYADRPRKISSEDAKLLEFGHLFHIFHHFCDQYDAHINEQIEKGPECCRVLFARDVLASFSSNGITTPDSLRYLSLFFQMRRAFYFIRSIVGHSESVVKLRYDLWNTIFTEDISIYERYLWDRMDDFSTLLLGETGTGKGMAAGAIGRSGFIPFNEKTGCFKESFVSAFIAINLSQFPEQLIESELFGHKKGAFTGAIENHRGILSCCSPCGAIFLDEIGDVTIPVQIKLLQILQERTFAPVGSHHSERFRGRVVAATNKNIDMLRAQGDFREDFYYRLCSQVIVVPSLRQRLAENRGELCELLKVTIDRILGKDSRELLGKMLDYIHSEQQSHYSWPGNIRELEQFVRRYLVCGRYHWQEARNAGHTADTLSKDIARGQLTANQLLGHYCTLLYNRYGSYEAVAKLINLDRRTVKKYVVDNEKIDNS